MSDHTRVSSSAPGISPEGKPPGAPHGGGFIVSYPTAGRGHHAHFWGCLIGCEQPSAAHDGSGRHSGIIAVGGTVDAHAIHLLIPVVLLALWAGRRNARGRLGAIGAALIALLPVLHPFLAVCAVVGGLILSRSDMGYRFMYIEFLILPAYFRLIITSDAWMRDRFATRLIGPTIFIGLVLHFFIPFAFTVIYAALAFIIIRTPHRYWECGIAENQLAIA